MSFMDQKEQMLKHFARQHERTTDLTERIHQLQIQNPLPQSHITNVLQFNQEKMSQRLTSYEDITAGLDANIHNI